MSKRRRLIARPELRNGSPRYRSQASRPALQALYEALSPEQKAVFDQASGWRGRRGHRHGGWFGHRDGGERPRWRPEGHEQSDRE